MGDISTTKNNEIQKTHPNFIIYETESNVAKVSVRLAEETVWLTQKQLAEIFDTTKQNIGQHIKNILEEGELDRNSVVKFFFTTAADGKNYNTEHYNLDMIISLGYRILSYHYQIFSYQNGSINFESMDKCRNKSRSDDTLLTVGFNLRQQATSQSTNPAGMALYCKYCIVPCGTLRGARYSGIRRLKPPVNQVLSHAGHFIANATIVFLN